MAEFAEQEITLPNGPRAGLKFRLDFMPWTRLLFEQIDAGAWRRIFMRGSVQSGKTLLGMQIPALYHLCEIGEDIIFAAPTVDLATDIWKDRVMPVLRASRYRHLWPHRGAGSRGGKASSVRLLNGASVRFMGAGGGDEQRSSHTARVVILTEIDKMDVPGETSREADPITQFEARTTAYGDRARIYGECTTSIEEGRIYQETDIYGTATRVVIQCPHCGNYIYPERDQFRSWQSADNVVAAAERARYVCQKCEAEWTESDRTKALQSPRLLHRGQSIDPDGNVHGDAPETVTFGITWNMMHSPVVSMGNIAEREWRAEHSQSESDARAIAQFVWSIPFKGDAKAVQLSYPLLAQHTRDWHFDPICAIPGRDERLRDPIPANIEFTIGAIDVQKHELYWTVDGFSRDDYTRWTLAWGVQEIVPEGAQWDPTEADLRRALDACRALHRSYNCESTWIDTGYRHEGAVEHVVRTWAAEQGAGVNALVGRSAGQMRAMTGKRIELPEGIPDMVQARLQDDQSVLWFLDVDRLKDEVYFRMFREFGSAGYHQFPREAANSRRSDRSRGPGAVGWIFSHYMRAKRSITLKGHREIRVWDEKGRHDLWDCAAYALAGAMVTLADILDEERHAPAKTQADKPIAPAQTTIRTSY